MVEESRKLSDLDMHWKHPEQGGMNPTSTAFESHSETGT